jgi:hypothetical protein
MLNNKKTWRCTLDGCSYFIHIGLAHILPGKMSVCWECGEVFRLDERALQDDQPKCVECRENEGSAYTAQERADIFEAIQIRNKEGVKTFAEVPRAKLARMETLGFYERGQVDRMYEVMRKFEPPTDEPDEIEVYEPDGE